MSENKDIEWKRKWFLELIAVKEQQKSTTMAGRVVRRGLQREIQDLKTRLDNLSHTTDIDMEGLSAILKRETDALTKERQRVSRMMGWGEKETRLSEISAALAANPGS
jgi:hypothetical protein